MFERRAFFWTLAGFLVSLFPFVSNLLGYNTSLDISDTWMVGFLFHFIGASVYALSEASIARKIAYLLIPIPLGFLLTFFWAVGFFNVTL